MDLLAMKRELLILSSQDMRDELLELELEDAVRDLNRLEGDGAFLGLDIAAFRGAVRRVEDELLLLDAGKGKPKIARHRQRLRAMEDARRVHDVRRATTEAEVAPEHPITPDTPSLPPKAKLLEDICGLRFVYVPPGRYPIGSGDGEHDQATGCWMSSGLFTLRHYQLVSLIPTHLSVTSIPAEVLASNRLTFQRVGTGAEDLGYSAVARKGATSASDPLELPYWFAATLASELGAVVPPCQLWECAARGSEGFEYPWGHVMDADEVYRRPDGTIESFGRYAAACSRPFGLTGLCSVAPEWNSADGVLGLPQSGVHHSPSGGDVPCTHLLRQITATGTLRSVHWPYTTARCGTFRLCFLLPVAGPDVPTRQDRFLERFADGSSALTAELMRCLGGDEMHLFQTLGRGEYADGPHIAWPSRGVSCTMSAARDVAAVHLHRGRLSTAPSIVDYAPYVGALLVGDESVTFASLGSAKDVAAKFKGTGTVTINEHRVEIVTVGDVSRVFTLCDELVIMMSVHV